MQTFVVRVRLLQKLALCMNGVDVSGLKVGDVLELSEDRAVMMVELEWAEYAGSHQRHHHETTDGRHSRDIPSN